MQTSRLSDVMSEVADQIWEGAGIHEVESELLASMTTEQKKVFIRYEEKMIEITNKIQEETAKRLLGILAQSTEATHQFLEEIA